MLLVVAPTAIELGEAAIGSIGGSVEGLLGGGFAENPLYAQAVHDVGQHYRWLKEYEKANRLYKHVLANCPDTEHALWSQADLIKSYLALKDDANVEAAVEKLLTGFVDNPFESRAIHDTAYELRKFKKYDQADQLDQFVIENWVGHEQTMWAKMDMVKTNILLENDADVETAIDELIADSNNHPNVAAMVVRLGEGYYDRGLRAQKAGNAAEAAENFTKAIDVWKTITEGELPVILPDTAHAWYMSGNANRAMKDFAKALEYYQKVVDTWPDYVHAWSAQYMIADCARKLERNGEMPKEEAEGLMEAGYLGVINNYAGSTVEKRALMELAGYYVEKEQWGPAIDYYNRLLEKDYGYLDKVYSSMLRCYNELGLTETASELERVKREQAN